MTRDEVRRLREEGLSLNQAEFGQLLGVHAMTVSKWERGVLKPNPYQVALLKEFRKAAGKEEVKSKLATILVGAGIAAALYLLLKYARK